MTHTKGNWKIEKESDGNLWISTDAIEPIANINCGYSDCSKKYEPSEEEIANAKLIAAAPKLLAFVIDMRDRYALSPHIYGPANELIKEATE